MRIVIDMQGAQSSSSRTRGIGRYTLALTQALVQNRGEHEVILALSSLFPETIEPIRAAFDGLLPQENIRVWKALGWVGDFAANNSKRLSAELIREAFVASLQPDILLITSLFEGYDAVTSIKTGPCPVPTAVVLHDLIPLIHREIYLKEPPVERWYLNRLDHLRRADLLLANSDSTRREALEHLGMPSDSVVNISAGCDARFRPLSVTESQKQHLRKIWA